MSRKLTKYCDTPFYVCALAEYPYHRKRFSLSSIGTFRSTSYLRCTRNRRTCHFRAAAAKLGRSGNVGFFAHLTTTTGCSHAVRGLDGESAMSAESTGRPRRQHQRLIATKTSAAPLPPVRVEPIDSPDGMEVSQLAASLQTPVGGDIIT